MQVTEEECKEFAKRLEHAARDKDRAAIDRLLPFEKIMVRCVNDLPLPADEKPLLLKRVTGGSSFLVRQILTELEEGGSYKLLRIHAVDGRLRIMFRLVSDEGVNYHDFVPARGHNATVGIEDVHLFNTGEMFSKTWRRTALPVVIERNRKGTTDLPKSEWTALNNLERIQEMKNAAQARKIDKVIAIYKSLPPELQREKTVVLSYVQAMRHDDVQCVEALELLRRLFPDDRAFDYWSITYFKLKKEYDAALKCVDRTDAAVGGDPYLHVERSELLLQAGRYKEARAEAEKTIAEEPSLNQGYWARIQVALKERNHVDTLAWLQKLVHNTDEEIEDLTTIPDYADFVKSPQHAQWLKWYQARDK